MADEKPIRTGYRSKPQDNPTDLKELYSSLKKEGIPCIIRRHPVAPTKNEQEKIIDLIGYVPSGTHQILVLDEHSMEEWIDEEEGRINALYSIIRGMVSFGYYETYEFASKDVDRFDTIEEVVSFIKDGLKKKASIA